MVIDGRWVSGPIGVIVMTLGSTALKDLFAHDAGRVENFSWEAAGIWFDWSKTHIDTAQLVAGVARLERAVFRRMASSPCRG